jgi:hypothetical protein
VAASAVECTLDGGPVTSTDADSGTAANCESSLQWQTADRWYQRPAGSTAAGRPDLPTIARWRRACA